MKRLTILVGRLYKCVVPTKYFFKVQLVGRFVPLVGLICDGVVITDYGILLATHPLSGSEQVHRV